MRTYVDPAMSAVHGLIDQLNERMRQVVIAEAEADNMQQGAGKAGEHQTIQFQLGTDLCHWASELNQIGVTLKSKA